MTHNNHIKLALFGHRTLLTSQMKINYQVKYTIVTKELLIVAHRKQITLM